MLPTVYGYADGRDVETLIQTRLKRVRAEETIEVARILGQAVFALLEINEAIPVHSKHRHLVAAALENFAEDK